ncbi:alpha/beta hydrolase [Roseimaritima ulvae]|uniref:Alpha/beta hydrolase family protein n=1 Tax=Roseimaritima ulvae TaxID=980254 RepID=A0A5B9QTH1_9BACT|nr:alpha/beta hydrolase [Roseimaritima ulvae]QEG41212.1 Alpha/beta hydrolase family protein [Roseimaritima ulvae]
MLLAAGLLTCFSAANSFAQPGGRPGAKQERPFEVVAIETRDGVRLRAAFFASDKGKDAVPVMIIHEWGGQAGPYLPLGLALNKAGCAVLIPDLRGHGGSMTYPVPGGGTEEFDIGDMGPAHVKAMLTQDLESCKAFLKEKNDKEELNLNALTLVGIKEGCVLSMEWAVSDWNFPSIGSRKQGQDVKALVLISPEEIHKGFRVEKAFRDRFVWRLPTLIVAGKASPEADAANKIYRRLVKLRARVSRGDPEGLELELANAKLSGVALLKADPSVTGSVVKFVEDEIIANILQHRWVSRSE